MIDSASDAAELERMVTRRVSGEPLEYIVGFADFCGVRVQLDPGVFIPRQRSEFLVRTATALAPPDAMALDLCCGCGALGLAFATLRPDTRVWASDSDPGAVANARRNLADVYEGDLFAALPDVLRRRIDIVLANVPYVPTSELASMPAEARDYEPASTHDGGADGLEILGRVLAQIRDWVMPGGHVVVELADAQRTAATTRFAAAGVDVRFDYSDEFDTTVAIGTI